MVGRLKSLPLTFAGGIGLGVFEQQLLGQWFDVFNPIRQAIPILFLFGLLLLLPQARLRAGRLSAGYIPRIPTLRTTLVAAGAFVVGTWVVSGMLEGKSVAYAGRGLVLAIIMLSLVLLTGFGGQVSLCQLTFAGLGAFAMGKVAGGASPLGLVAAIVLAGAVGAIVALPALRLQGLYLALSTLAFAVATSEILFKNEIAFGYGSNLAMGRIPGTESDRAFLVFCALVFAGASIGVLALRRAHFGRRLAAMGDSPAACATIGMNLTSTKLVVFGVSAGLAGLGGALLGSFRGSVGQIDFDMFQSLVLLLLISTMGIRNVSAALLAGLSFSLAPLLTDAVPQITSAPFLLAGLGAIAVGRNPAGIIGDLAQRYGAWQQRSRTAGAPSTSTRPVRTGVESLAGAGR
jgi:branched-chain amino acid transport system permease protein